MNRQRQVLVHDDPPSSEMILSGHGGRPEVAIGAQYRPRFWLGNGRGIAGVSRLSSRDGSMSRCCGRPPDTSGEWAFTEILGPSVRDHVVGVVR